MLRICVLAAAVAVLSLTGTPAGAQGFFNSWFGNGQRPDPNSWFGRRPSQPVPPQTSAYSDPGNPSDRPVYNPIGQPPAAAPAPDAGTGHQVAYCVRTCDGRYFPMQRHANANPVQLCSAFCPAAKTVVLNGGQIDSAVAADGTRYSSLEHAFAYRQKIIPGCTCNGKDPFGLARIDVTNDPTIRPGDIVASGDNVKAALIAMAAAKERQPLQDSVNAKPMARPAAVRRVAGPTVAVPVEPEVAPGDEPEQKPED